jgi:hypothetical protein
MYLLVPTTGTFHKKFILKRTLLQRKLNRGGTYQVPIGTFPKNCTYTDNEGNCILKTAELTWCKGQHIPACSANKLLDPGNCHQLKQYASRLEQEKLPTVQLRRSRQIKVFRIIVPVPVAPYKIERTSLFLIPFAQRSAVSVQNPDQNQQEEYGTGTKSKARSGSEYPEPDDEKKTFLLTWEWTMRMLIMAGKSTFSGACHTNSFNCTALSKSIGIRILSIVMIGKCRKRSCGILRQ